VPARWDRRPHGRTRKRPGEPRGVAAPRPHLDQRADDDPHHRVQERVAHYPHRDTVFAEVLLGRDLDELDPTHGAPVRSTLCDAEGAEVVLAEEATGGIPHRGEVERPTRPPGDPFKEQRRDRSRYEPVAVLAGLGVEAGGEARGRPADAGHDDAVAHKRIERTEEFGGLGLGTSASNDTTWPSACTPASVRPAPTV
jgi:hypothetical protein